jgi:hypothetical protein
MEALIVEYLSHNASNGMNDCMLTTRMQAEYSLGYDASAVGFEQFVVPRMTEHSTEAKFRGLL